jgi:4-hydroxybenzoate polyprenyltransferase
MTAFFKLIRPINLLIVGFTMYSVRFFYFDLAKLKLNINQTIWHEKLDFFLLVFSTILIAAGGNIINDYFDVKADRINRPERLIISKQIKQRWAIISHWILNGIAFAIAIYLSARYTTFWYVFIHLISINTLWFYSMHFKKKAIIGNLLIASLTALVPILCGIHFYIVGNLNASIFFSNENYPSWIYFLAKDGKFIFGMAFFAFILNFSREIIKDIQDVKGDKVIFAKTLPILIGEKKSAFVASAILFVLPITFFVLYIINVKFIFTDIIFFIPFILSVLLTAMICFILLIKHSKKSLKFYDSLIKVAMLLGLILPIYWYFLL